MRFATLLARIAIIGCIFASTLASAAQTAGPPVELALKNPAPAIGEALQFQVGVTTQDQAGWTAGSYSVTIELRASNGAVVATSRSVSGDSALPPGQTAVLFVTVASEGIGKGAYRAQAKLNHEGKPAGEAEPRVVAIGAVALGAVPAETTPSRRGTLDGNLATNLDIANTIGESAMLTLTGKGGDVSYNASGGITTSGGGNKPLLTLTTPQSQVQAGTFSASFDPISFDGATGAGVALKHVYSPVSLLQLAWITGARGTLNPYTVAGLSLSVPIKDSRSTLAVTLGTVHVAGPPPAQRFPFVDDGRFISGAFQHNDPKTSLVYAFRYGIMLYTDKATLERRTDNIFEAAAQFTTGKAGWNLDLTRASAFYPTISATSVTPDRLTEKIAVNLPVGAIQASISANGYSDDLPGALLAQRTHFWTEAINLSTAFKNGDSLSYSFAGATQHQAADLSVAPTATDLANATDASTFSYSAKRGLYALGATLGYNNQHDSTNSLQHSTQLGLNLARTVSEGLSIGTSFQLTNNVSNSPSSTNISLAAALTLGYSRGPLTLTSAASTSRMRPLLGQRQPDSSALNFGVGIKL